MVIITMPRANALDIIRSGEATTGCIRTAEREKVTVPRYFRCLAFEHLSHNCDSGNNTTKPCFLCGAMDHLAANFKNEPNCTEYEAIGADHIHRCGSANGIALGRTKERRLNKRNGKVYTNNFTYKYGTQATQDLLYQTAKEHEAGILLIFK